ncbi:sialate O-acetylesterase [Hymenobacter sp. ASUV-10]|uniref:Sialate O-acetylesterase n=1 Tax=Hymenobacter aranciens TaxID=3063996 RepID=A0ABT9BKB6_9BACT|nr:sialate O-acetylesterase [Hymenobacter sp. ASUV-10]MDO7877091.1 sialate O-acetylesterase [Hymenobacter sp. ASUV-10]
MLLKRTSLLLALLGGSLHYARATVRLPRFVADHMVLQRDAPVPLWGWAEAGETVTVTFKGQTYKATPTPGTGRWQVSLPPQPAGGPYELTIKGQNTMTLRDVLFGDVWLASGQSNMEWPVRDAVNGKQEVAAANYPQIRLLNVDNTATFSPQVDIRSAAGWQVCGPGPVAGFSAVAYFFGRDLFGKHHVPIGLIGSEWGGTPAEAWTSAAALRPLADFDSTLDELATQTGSAEAVSSYYAAREAAFQAGLLARDQGRRTGPTGWWASPAFDARAWATMPLPGHWENPPASAELRNFDGIIWLRREVELSAAEARQPAVLHLGQIDDVDSVWVNGVPVGGLSGWDIYRRYVVPAHALRPGRNVLAVRVTDYQRGGGIAGPPDSLRLDVAGRRLPLAGAWPYHIGLDLSALPTAERQMLVPYRQPTLLYNGMIAPLVGLGLKGVIWYQGEDNAARAAQYRTLFPTLIRSWRTAWGRPDLPFLFVQLANFQPDQPQPANYEWAELREAQARALALPHTGMAVAIDLGDRDDIHPRNKQEVGHRLALAAARVAYGDTRIVSQGPTPGVLKTAGNTLRLPLQANGSSLLFKGSAGATPSFAIAGADRKFYWATVRFEGSTLVLSSPQVPAPVAVRYAWGNSPFPSLYNRQGLPAAPFRTDDWPGLTEGRQ